MAKTEPVDLCTGCGSEGPHPWVGVTRDEDKRMVALPVCKKCHENPAHRKAPLKMHFFPRAVASEAVQAAEMRVLQDAPTKEQEKAQREWEKTKKRP